MFVFCFVVGVAGVWFLNAVGYVCFIFRYDASSSVQFDNIPDGTTSIERSDWGKWGVTDKDKKNITGLSLGSPQPLRCSLT